MKFRAAVAAVVLSTLTLVGCVPPHPEPVPLQVLSFNDFHGHLEPPAGTDANLGALDPISPADPVGGSEYLATTLTQLRANHANTLTATAGDLIGGTPFLSGLFHDEPAVEALEKMGLDVSSVGNHEFDEGLTELIRMQYGGCHPADGCYFPNDPYDGAKFPWLAANVQYPSGQSVLPPTWVNEVGGVKVGFIGMTLEGTPDVVSASGIQGLSFEDEVETANVQAFELQSQGVQAIITLIHEGGVQVAGSTFDQCNGISGPIVDIATNLDPAIDMVISGHTHQPYVCDIADPAGQPRKVTSASSFGRVVTETNLDLDPKSGDVIRSSVESVNHKVVRTVAPDPALTAVITKWKAIADPIANQVVGSVTAPITRSITRDTESSLANLIADAQLAATDGPTEGSSVIALMNPGGVRADITFDPSPAGEAPGEVTFGEAFTTQPFGNLLVRMDLTGAQLVQVLQEQAPTATRTTTLILGVSNGLTFDYDSAAAPGSRVSNVALNGTAIDPAATYRVTVNSFLADGGDSFATLKLGTNRLIEGDDLTAFTDHLGANSPVDPPATDRIDGV